MLARQKLSPFNTHRHTPSTIAVRIQRSGLILVAWMTSYNQEIGAERQPCKSSSCRIFYFNNYIIIYLYYLYFFLFNGIVGFIFFINKLPISFPPKILTSCQELSLHSLTLLILSTPYNLCFIDHPKNRIHIHERYVAHLLIYIWLAYF